MERDSGSLFLETSNKGFLFGAPEEQTFLILSSSPIHSSLHLLVSFLIFIFGFFSASYPQVSIAQRVFRVSRHLMLNPRQRHNAGESHPFSPRKSEIRRDFGVALVDA